MRIMDWQQLSLDPGVKRELSPDANRIILWLSVAAEGGARQWERISNVSGAVISEADGVFASAATAIRARQKGGGLFGKLLGKLRGSPDALTWMLPSGGTAEQVGERQSDLHLVWSDAASGPLTEETIAARWSNATRRQRLGGNLYLVGGVEPPRHEPAAPKPVRESKMQRAAPSAPGVNLRQ